MHIDLSHFTQHRHESSVAYVLQSEFAQLGSQQLPILLRSVPIEHEAHDIESTIPIRGSRRNR